MNRRDFLRYALAAAGGVALNGCRASHDDMTIDNPAANAAWTSYQKRALNNQTIDQFFADAATTFAKGPSLKEVPSIDYDMMTSAFGKDNAEALKYLAAVNDYTSQMAKGEHLELAAVATALYGMRDDLANWLKMTPEQRETAEYNFRKSLNTDQGKLFDQVDIARGELSKQLMPSMRAKYGQQLKNFKADIALGTYDGVFSGLLGGAYFARKSAEDFIAAANHNIAETQKWLNAKLALYVCEGDWGSDVRSTINLLEDLSEVRDGYRMMDMAAKEAGRTIEVDGDAYTLETLANEKIAKVAKKFAKRDNNYKDDIFQDMRFPVANAYARLASEAETDKQIPVQAHLGGIYSLDDRISIAAGTKGDLLYNVLDGVAEMLPIGYDVYKILADLEYMVTPNSPKGQFVDMMTKVMKAHGGFDDADWRVGNENVFARVLIRTMVAGLKYGSIAAGIAKSSGSDGGSDGGSSDPGKATARGTEEGGNGVNPVPAGK